MRELQRERKGGGGGVGTDRWRGASRRKGKREKRKGGRFKQKGRLKESWFNGSSTKATSRVPRLTSDKINFSRCHTETEQVDNDFYVSWSHSVDSDLNQY